MSFGLKALIAVADTASAATSALARRQALLRAAAATPAKGKKKGASCSVCEVGARQERAKNLITDIQVIAGTRAPTPAVLRRGRTSKGSLG